MKPDLYLEQRQIITPQLLLKLKLLALPNLELETLVRAELEQNPTIELITDSNEPTEKDPLVSAENEETSPETNPEEFDLKELLSDDTYALPNEAELVANAEETTTNPKSSLAESLLPFISPYISINDLPIAEYIIGNLDDDGFLNLTADQISQALPVSSEQVHNVLSVVQNIEPGGIACANLQQALLLQLGILGYGKDSLEHKIVHDYYDLLLKRQTDKIAKLLNISESEVSYAVLNLKNLDSRPARRYLHNATAYIHPDFMIYWQDDKLVALINDESIPVLRVAPRYREIIQHPKNFSDEEVDFARSKVHGALNLIRAIDSRKQLLRRIINYIVDNQREFLINGKEFIRPIPIKTVAQELNVHVSTISRACQAKYVETPVGIYPLKFFFTTGIGAFSRDSLKEKIQNIINSEDKTKPFTDDEIVALLAQQNIKLSRRTVAKYREELNIFGSNERIQK
ncbi:MAG: RNA polymerase factor sigma-54 [Candidatus Latescibacteria bacterium]|nr:RNA polymerase factor sigma-54 [Candidatus Latescibacterota bacterium]